MTRLISNWVRPTVAAKIAVVAPITVTKSSTSGASSNSGDRRATMNTPAVTMVAAWISAETGVGPSIASGSQVWSRNCADLPMAPMNSRKQITLTEVWNEKPNRPGSGWSASTWLATSSTPSAPEKATDPVSMKAPKIPSAKPKSPTRLTMKAFIAAALAEGLWYQNPISR